MIPNGYARRAMDMCYEYWAVLGPNMQNQAHGPDAACRPVGEVCDQFYIWKKVCPSDGERSLGDMVVFKKKPY